MLANASHSLVVDDARSNPSFALRATTIDLGIGAYTGISLQYGNGQVYGTLCTLHPEARAPEPAELALMPLAGRIVMQAVEAEDHRRRERAQDSARLYHQLRHDPLTGLGNSTRLHEYLDELLLSGGHKIVPFALLVIELDHLKYINDAFGYQAGDRLLHEISGRMSATLADQGLLIRLGGDEFVAVLPDSDQTDAVHAAEHLLSAVAEPSVLSGHTVRIAAHLGLALYPDHGQDAPTLLHRAGIALYRAGASPTRHAVYESGQDAQARRRVALANSLHEAIEQSQLTLHYQPQVHLDTRQLRAVEALVRWQHPEFGVVPPSDFIPLIEAMDLIEPLTRWVVREAVRQRRSWEALGIDLRVSVNLSARSLQSNGVVDMIAEILDREDAEPACLKLEVTEGAMMADPQHSSAILAHLHDRGIGSALDDFGTGYSSLTYLARLPLGELKIDLSFIQELPTNPDNYRIVKGTIDLAHDLELAVVAEGVEDEETVHLLESLSCDLVQGYVVSRPLPADACTQWLATHC